MPSDEKVIQIYEELAAWYARQGLDQLRDRFLVLAADAALNAGKADQAERLRARLLENSPHHLLKPFGSLAEALKTPDVQNYVSGLRRGYPPESAASLLENLRSGKTGSEAAQTRPPTAPAAGGRLARAAPPVEEVDETLRFPAAAQAAKPAAHRPSGGSAQPPAVYAIQDPTEESKGEAASGRGPKQTPPAPAAKKPAPRSAAPPPASPSKARPAIPIRSAEPAARRPLEMGSPAASRAARPVDREEAVDLAGAWLPTVLFVLLLLATMGLAIYTLAAPFVRPG
jgi:hypothetical protein